MKSVKKILLITVGLLSVTLGVLGIFLPLLPTTPFLLLASFCFLRSSDRLYSWLINHKIFGKYIYNYLKYKAVTLKTKITAVTLLWISISISIIVVNNNIIRIMLLIIAVAVSAHLISLRVFREDNPKEKDK